MGTTSSSANTPQGEGGGEQPLQFDEASPTSSANRPRSQSHPLRLNESNDELASRSNEDAISSARFLTPRSGSSSASSSAAPSAPCWCIVKSKTRSHNSSRVTRRAMWFEGKQGKKFSVGRSADCDLRLEDDRCASLNALLSSTFKDGVYGISLKPEARIYQLVGMGNKRNLCNSLIFVGAVIKVGSVSLEVTDMNTQESDDFSERFAAELGSTRSLGNPKQGESHETEESTGNTYSGSNEGTSSDGSYEGAPTGPKGQKHNAQKKGPKGKAKNRNSVRSSGSGDEETVACAEDLGDVAVTVKNDDDRLSSDDELEDDDEAMCYICWGGEEALSPKAAESAGDDFAEGQAPGHGCSQRSPNPNPLITNPCGKCSGSSRYVHLNCLLKWIKSSGSGHCSICNGPLPQHFSSPPPNIELKVVRHRRGQSWVGTRRFRLSFAERDTAIIGRDSEADIRLTDRSVGSVHARITFNKETRQFQLADCYSLGGTFLQVRGTMELEPEKTTYLKIGRTLLTVRMTQRKGTLLNMLQGFSSHWSKRG